MASSFASVSLEEKGLQNGRMLPIHGAQAGYTVIPIPGGASVYLQAGQQKPGPFRLPVRVTAAQLASLRAKVNTSGSLVYVGGTVTATLENIDPQEVKQPNDMYFVTLNFLI